MTAILRNCGPDVRVVWVAEDELPPMRGRTFDDAFKVSRVIGGIRMYPAVRLYGVLCYLIVPGDVSDDFEEEFPT